MHGDHAFLYGERLQLFARGTLYNALLDSSAALKYFINTESSPVPGVVTVWTTTFVHFPEPGNSMLCRAKCLRQHLLILRIVDPDTGFKGRLLKLVNPGKVALVFKVKVALDTLNNTLIRRKLF